MMHDTQEAEQTGLGAAVMALQRLAGETIEAARQGQLVETDLLTMRIGIMADAIRQSDRTEAQTWRPQLALLLDQLSELGEILGGQESRLKSEMAARALRATDAYR